MPAPNGVPRKVPKKCFGLRASVLLVQRLEGRSTFSALSSAPRLGPALSEALLSALLSGWGFGTSVAGRQDCNSRRILLGNSMCSLCMQTFPRSQQFPVFRENLPAGSEVGQRGTGAGPRCVPGVPEVKLGRMLRKSVSHTPPVNGGKLCF